VLVLLESGNSIVDTLLPVLAVLFVALLAIKYVLYRQEAWVATCFTLAERDFNNNLSSGLEHGGRKGRAAERREWNEMAVPPRIQVNKDGYRTATHDLIAANEQELKGKGAAIGKAAATAFLLRELYEGNVDAAQSKIFADTLNSGGTLPYIAPGIYELVGFDKFDPKTGFPPNAGIPRWLLLRVVRSWHYPREILMVKTDSSGKRFPVKGLDAISELTQQQV
jgi:hypothetical protein